MRRAVYAIGQGFKVAGLFLVALGLLGALDLDLLAEFNATLGSLATMLGGMAERYNMNNESGQVYERHHAIDIEPVTEAQPTSVPPSQYTSQREAYNATTSGEEFQETETNIIDPQNSYIDIFDGVLVLTIVNNTSDEIALYAILVEVGDNVWWNVMCEDLLFEPPVLPEEEEVILPDVVLVPVKEGDRTYVKPAVVAPPYTVVTAAFFLVVIPDSAPGDFVRVAIEGFVGDPDWGYTIKEEVYVKVVEAPLA
ncbi:hypothetical protein APE_1408 [Aeropyrum pernix K1]|uniref:Uncharacterized protein n=1 Tax=Aeropyrum pernix (strain ATCC 700893 / DSM 11879 / JCM 9820 / NBRC 100138 / K1) TaxID=272557 RepID=Q9YC43_AERPE|nr:hypothetical protein [Aeropyrum pernix]BAA80405.1 hypothetical protein APE_1408 [Aeropyrum pernix K1]